MTTPAPEQLPAPAKETAAAKKRRRMANAKKRADAFAVKDARIAELEAVAWKTQRALAPFANRVFNDNGDMTVDTLSVDHDELVAAYWASRAVHAVLGVSDA